MASVKVITAQYIEFIAKEVIAQFGGSYQNYQTCGKSWRQKMDYNVRTERFIMDKTRVFLRLLDIHDLGNLNAMYKVCYNISEHLSKYIAKKSPDVSRAMVTEDLLNKLFFDFDLFKSRFKKSYKRPIDTSNAEYVKCNPGVIAMYKAINQGR